MENAERRLYVCIRSGIPNRLPTTSVWLGGFGSRECGLALEWRCRRWWSSATSSRLSSSSNPLNALA